MNEDDRDFISSTIIAKMALVIICGLNCTAALMVVLLVYGLTIKNQYVAAASAMFGVVFCVAMFVLFRIHDNVVDRRKDRAIFGGMKYLW